MLMLDNMRAEFARFLGADPAARFRMDAALVHVITLAYSAGLADGKTSAAMGAPESDLEQLLRINSDMANGLQAAADQREGWPLAVKYALGRVPGNVLADRREPIGEASNERSECGRAPGSAARVAKKG